MAEEVKKKKDHGRWFREMKSELKKVVWPNKQHVLKNTGTVLLCSAAIADVHAGDRRLYLDLRCSCRQLLPHDHQRSGRLRSNEMTDSAKWYVVHTYSGYENKVKTSLEKAIENRGMSSYFFDIQIPMETVVEQDGDKEREIEDKVFPSYVLIKMIMSDESWHVVRNIRGVTGFVGPGSKPVPLTDEEVTAMGVERIPIILNIEVGENVRVVSGPLENFLGRVDKIDPERQKVKLSVSMFGRETPVELDFIQVQKI